jgi:hypothetical protein
MPTHAHFKEEFGPRRAKKIIVKSADGSQKLSKKNENDVGYRAARAEHFVNEAWKATEAHGNAKTDKERTVHEATVAHAAQRAGVHARYVTKHAPGTELADKATLHAQLTRTIHERFKSELMAEAKRQEMKSEKKD